MKIVCNGLDAYGHFAITELISNQLLAIGFFERSKTKQRGIAAALGKYSLKWNYTSLKTNESDWHGTFTPCSMGHDRFTYCVAVSDKIGKDLLFTTDETMEKDLYSYLMGHYKLPLLREWIPVLQKTLLTKRLVNELTLRVYKGAYRDSVVLSLNRKNVSIDKIRCLDLSLLTEDAFQETVSQALKSKKICITRHEMEPLSLKNFDDYLTRYGASLVDNLNKQLEPLVPLKPNVDCLAIKEKSLFPQQAASVNGVLAMIDHGYKHTVLNMGMGVGKSLQAASVIEAAMVRKWLKKHPDKTLRDAYEPDTISYRAIIMAPGHLLEKWKSEVESEIPYAKATILQGGLSQLVELKNSGREPSGKEFYILSKDYAKLDSWQSPIPTQIKSKPFSLAICADCKEEAGKIQYKKGFGKKAVCPQCTGDRFVPMPLKWEGYYHGLVCPSCGELLIRNRGYDVTNGDFLEHLQEYVLTPKDFASPKTDNSICYHCGAPLWGNNAMPLSLDGIPPKEPKWYKITHFSNHAMKTKTTAFVLKNHESEYLNSCITTKGYHRIASAYGPRKVSPAKYIKKQLKGFFDFCVLDEAHQYLGESAQGVAAHALIKASRFTLALTGTISNGTASSFFNLFWMLAPYKMIREGYAHTSADLLRFCKDYGCVETLYEANNTGTFSKNLMSRGRQLSTPRIKPGISPVLLNRFLLDSCLYLDLSDMSKHLPKFSEQVKLVPLPDDIRGTYNHVIDILTNKAEDGGGMGLLSVMLQFALSYPDKPYGRGAIMDPYTENAILAYPDSYDQYADPDVLTPKEEALVEIVNKEIEEGRNCFVYAAFTGKPETNVTWRLQSVIERHCNLTGRVIILQSSSPAASKREAWFHQRAADGIKVFITNYQNVETGMDFCFKHNGRTYNYPTLIYYQTGYVLEHVWQSSRRAYRLNQREECRNYYLAYENTYQMKALELMAKKQSAAAAIQGKFSTEGLCAMAKGVDARAQLAAALSQKDMCSRASLENMFDALNQEVSDDGTYSDFIPSLTYYELMGVNKELSKEESIWENLLSFSDVSTNMGLFLSEPEPEEEAPSAPTEECDPQTPEKEDPVTDPKQNEFLQSMSSFFGIAFQEVTPDKATEQKKKTRKSEPAGQVDLFSFLEV